MGGAIALLVLFIVCVAAIQAGRQVTRRQVRDLTRMRLEAEAERRQIEDRNEKLRQQAIDRISRGFGVPKEMLILQPGPPAEDDPKECEHPEATVVRTWYNDKPIFGFCNVCGEYDVHTHWRESDD